MKNLQVKNIVIFAAGAIIGATTGIYAYKKATDESIEERIQEELASIKDYSERRKHQAEQREKEEDLIDPTDDDRPVGDIIRDDEDEEYQEDDHLPTKYNTYSTGKVVDAEPEIMDVEDYFEENTPNDKVTLTFYASDATLVDENEEIVHDINNTVGEMALRNFGKMADDPDVVYVRNSKLGIDYEIIRVYQSFAEDVLGITRGEASKNDRIRGNA